MNDLDTKITMAMERIESLFYETNGKCYLSFSGGKDSTVILALIKMCVELGTIEPIKAIFSNTGIELGATVEFVKWCKANWYEQIEIIRPQKTFSWIVNNKGKPIRSKMKSQYIGRYQKTHNTNTLSFEYMLGDGSNGKTYAKTRIADKDFHMIHENFDIKITDSCCTYLKKKPFEKYNKDNDIKGYIVGERMAEGGVREMSTIKRLKNGGKLCTKTKGNYIVKLPIIDWTDEDVEEFIKKYNVPLSKAYTEMGYERTGCFLCPFSLQIDENLKKLHQYEPNRYKAALFWLKDVYIAQNVTLPFDEEYERERKQKWLNEYDQMRYEMLAKYRPNKAEKRNNLQTDIFDFI